MKALLGKKALRVTAFAGLCSLVAAPILAQNAPEAFKALQGMLGGMAKKAAPAPAPTSAAPAGGLASIAAVKAALKGKWESDLATCRKPTDSYYWGDDGSWSGYEWSCQVPAAAYNARGFKGTLACSSEGNDYPSPTELLLSADGKTAHVTNLEDKSVRTLVKCPKETDSIMP